MHVARQFISVFTTTAIVVILAITNGGNATLPETIKWIGGNFEWPCPTTKNMFKSSGKYISKNVIATRVALYTNNAIVALPRYKSKNCNFDPSDSGNCSMNRLESLVRLLVLRLIHFEQTGLRCRYKAGIPVTLAKISQDVQSCEATLVPYPCWSLQEEGTCTALQNVVDIYLDPQNILWVLDTGVVNTLDEPMRRCPPKILAVNVVTGKVSVVC